MATEKRRKLIKSRYAPLLHWLVNECVLMCSCGDFTPQSKKQQHFTKIFGRKSCLPQLHKLYKCMSPYTLLIYYHNTCILKYALVCTKYIIIHQYCKGTRWKESPGLNELFVHWGTMQWHGIFPKTHKLINNYNKVEVNTKISKKLPLNTK